MIQLAVLVKAMTAIQATGPIAVDGVLDDDTWQAALWVDDFAQKEPTENAPPTQRTEVAIAFDDDALYVAARMHLDDVSTLDRPMTRRDDTSGAERIIISLDPARTRRTAYSFAVTAAGVRADWIHTDDSEGARDASWNPVWRAEIQVTDDAWTAEMRIPWSQLRYPDDEQPVWGIDLNRFVPRTREDDFWIVVPKDRTGWSSYFGELRGLRVHPTPRLELLPYVAGDIRFADDVDPGGNVGLDVKLGLGPSLTLDAAINPDFGQVEVDPAVVNLDAYEIFFPERRPFFVEGSQIFTSQPRRYFYTRRIGARSARILGAAKLTGQIVPRTTVGAVAAVTAESDDAPRTGWGVLRLERELDEDASIGGITLTGVARDSDAPTSDALPQAAVTGGADLRKRFADGTYELFGAIGGSAVAGRPSAIAAIETSSAHYFQRPDADHVELHPESTLLTGLHLDLGAAKRAGDWRFSFFGGAETPGLELNDLGTLSSADDISGALDVIRVETTPSRWLHAWSIALHDDESWNFGGTHKPSYTELGFGVTLPSFVRVDGGVGVTRPGLSDDETRGGPLMELGPSLSAELAINSPNAGHWVWGWRGFAVTSGTETTGVDTGARVQWQPIDRLRVELAPSLRVLTNRSQYVTQLDDRYLFATLELRELSTDLRVQAALTPDLTIDAYAQPFASSGRYVALGELAAPGTREPRRYDDVSQTGASRLVTDGGESFYVDDPDFTVLSLRSTVVVRWEWRPGSTLYAVWQQARASDDAYARALSPGLFGDVVTAPGEQIIAVKLSYWYGL